MAGIGLARVHAADDGQLRILVLGSTRAYQSDPNLVENAEEAFPPLPVASNLEQILIHDTNITQTILVQAQDIVQTNADLSSLTLMSWFYWPDNRANNTNLLHQAWDYAVLIDDPHVASTFPEYHLEGVKQISEEVRKDGCQPLLVMTWSSSNTDLSTFGEMAYRVGAGTGVPVMPAGYAWTNVSPALHDAGQRPTPRGAYVTAATIYSHLFNRSAKVSSYVPDGSAPLILKSHINRMAIT